MLISTFAFERFPCLAKQLAYLGCLQNDETACADLLTCMKPILKGEQLKRQLKRSLEQKPPSRSPEQCKSALDFMQETMQTVS